MSESRCPMAAPPGPAATGPAATGPDYAQRVRGCLLGGALADAAADPGTNSPAPALATNVPTPDPATGAPATSAPLHFSSTTQMTLYTIDGLLEALEWARDGVASDELACLWLAYLRWLAAQGHPVPPSAPAPPPRWIDGQSAVRRHRNPDPVCLSALAGGEMGTEARPVNALSRGAGALCRSAPFGLIPHVGPEYIYRLSARAAALTHGHRAARQSAAAFSRLIHALVFDGASPRTAALSALRRLQSEPMPDPAVASGLEHALELAAAEPQNPRLPTSELLHGNQLPPGLGADAGAARSLAVAVYAVLATCPGAENAAGQLTPQQFAQEHYIAAIQLAAIQLDTAVDGASGGRDGAPDVLDPARSIAGNILGAYYGEACLPPDRRRAVAGIDVVTEMAAALIAVTS